MPSKRHSGCSSASAFSSIPPPAPSTSTRASAGALSAKSRPVILCRWRRPGTSCSVLAAYPETISGSQKDAIQNLLREQSQEECTLNHVTIYVTYKLIFKTHEF